MHENYLINSLGLMSGEGTGFFGLGASFSFRGTISLNGKTLSVFGLASSGLLGLPGDIRPSITFEEKAFVYKNNKIIFEKQLNVDSQAFIDIKWHDGGIFTYIGSVDIDLPEPIDLKQLTLVLVGTCRYNTGSGIFSSLNGVAKGNFNIIIEK